MIVGRILDGLRQPEWRFPIPESVEPEAYALDWHGVVEHLRVFGTLKGLCEHLEPDCPSGIGMRQWLVDSQRAKPRGVYRISGGALHRVEWEEVVSAFEAE